MAAPNRKLLGNTIAREQFLLNEARIMARLRLEGMSADDAARKVKEEKAHHLADQMIEIDLDDGVKHNYALFQDVLSKIK